MASTVIADHNILGIIHVQVLRDDQQADPQQAFSARINAPGVNQTLPLNNAANVQFPLHAGAINGTVRAEVDDFTVLPGGATAANATGISCKIVFKVNEIFTITLGSIPITASFHHPHH